jgi:mono/diheme cytochrome c family protein
MPVVAKIGIVVASTLLVLAISTMMFIGSGVYNIGADDHHTRIVLTIIEQLRNRSIAVRSQQIDVPSLTDPKNIAAGAQRYQALCIGCHLAPGLTKSDIRIGLYPHPPNLAEEDVDDAQRAFWIIKHGIKMSAMPAWGKILNDEAIWDILSFVRQMPRMTPQEYQQLTRAEAD